MTWCRVTTTIGPSNPLTTRVATGATARRRRRQVAEGDEAAGDEELDEGRPVAEKNRHLDTHEVMR